MMAPGDCPGSLQHPCVASTAPHIAHCNDTSNNALDKDTMLFDNLTGGTETSSSRSLNLLNFQDSELCCADSAAPPHPIQLPTYFSVRGSCTVHTMKLRVFLWVEPPRRPAAPPPRRRTRGRRAACSVYSRGP